MGEGRQVTPIADGGLMLTHRYTCAGCSQQALTAGELPAKWLAIRDRYAETYFCGVRCAARSALFEQTAVTFRAAWMEVPDA
mgnify:CR=1 FL=1